MIKALLFDMDGVLVSTEDLSMTIGKRYFESKGARCSKKNFEKHLGMGERTFFDGANSEVHLKDYSYDEASRFFKDEYLRDLDKIEIALPGAREILKAAKELGLKIAICSSAPDWKVRVNFNALGFNEDYVDLILTGKDVTKNKPDPDIYLKAMEILGVKSNEAIVFEDTKGGIESGKRSGSKTVSVLNTISLSEAESAGADFIVTSLRSFSTKESLEGLLKRASDYKNPIYRKFGSHYVGRSKRAMMLSLEEKIKNAEKMAWDALENAYSPFSHFRVGSALISYGTGKIYSGCNVENSSYGATICAERNAVTTAVSSEGALGIEAIVIVSEVDPPAPPCAVCRQFLTEFSDEHTKVILISKSGYREEFEFSDLMPYPFILDSK